MFAMVPKLTMVDNFYDDPWLVRRLALNLHYDEPKTTTEKIYYKGLMSTPYHPFAGLGIELIGRALRRVLWWPFPIGEFRLLLSGEFAGDVKGTWVHTDGIAARYAGLVYLNLPSQCDGGTSFYRHREFGWEHMPDESSPEVSLVRRQSGRTFREIIDKLSDDGFREEKWDLLTHVPMRFNRCVIFEGNQFHARTGSFGHSLANGRMTQNFFFNVAS